MSPDPNEFTFVEPVIGSLIIVLEKNLPAILTMMNENYDDGVDLITPIQFVPYRPTQATWEQGLPCIGISELPTRFEDDNVSMVNAVHSLCIWTVVQNSDHGTLTKMLRRYLRANIMAIQQDRAFKSGAKENEYILSRANASVWGVKFEGTVPGDMLEERTPDSPSEIPTSYLSWVGLIISMKKAEVG